MPLNISNCFIITLYKRQLLSSTQKPHSSRACVPSDWRRAGLRYYRYSHFLRHRFGGRVQRVSLDAGFTCPNVDGRVTTGGCNFCDNRSFSPSRRMPQRSIAKQLDEGIARIRRRYNCDRFLAYFQPATNTYAPLDRLREVYRPAIEDPRIVGLAIGTRPDCVPDSVLELLEAIAAETYLSVEYGMQTKHNRSLDWINRGHHHDAFLDAMQRSRNRGIEIGAQVILGLPGETSEDMLETARELAGSGIDSIKIHNLYAVRNTRLAEEVTSGTVRLMEHDEYVDILVSFLELLPPHVVVERISGDAPREFFVAPEWCLHKQSIREAVDREFVRRDSWQGKRYGQPE